MSDTLAPRRSRGWGLMGVGVVGVLLLEGMLLAGVNGWSAGTGWARWTGWVRENMTPLAWCFYIVVLMGWLNKLEPGVRGWVRRHKWRLMVLWLWSVTCWCYFDWVNFYFMRDPETGLRAWEYIGMPTGFGDRVVGYLIAFGAIAPGMFLTAEVMLRLGVGRVRSKGISMPWWVLWGLVAVGVGLCVVPVVVGRAVSNLALWVGMFALLDPLNYACGRPSILRDWQHGRWGRTLALGAGGLWCGFLWEFWNYWALAKWTYHLPFLGATEHVRYFEMPVLGLLGFVAFGIEVWVMWQTSLVLLKWFVEGEGSMRGDVRLRVESCL